MSDLLFSSVIVHNDGFVAFHMTMSSIPGNAPIPIAAGASSPALPLGEYAFLANNNNIFNLVVAVDKVSLTPGTGQTPPGVSANLVATLL